MPASKIALAVLISAGALTAVTAGIRAQAPGAAKPVAITITAETGANGVAVPESLYGVFFEEINHAGDGGLYGELVRNRSFEDGAGLPGWKAVIDSGDGELSLTTDSTNPLNEKNPTTIRVKIPDGKSRLVAGVANDGYWGVPVTKGAKYDCSLYARRDGEFGNARLTVRLESADGKRIYAEAKLPALTEDWKQHSVTLTAKASDPKARLAVLAEKPGTFWLDMVSLFPKDTFKGRENGMRKDLGHMVAAMKPGFFRFPGGCFVEGDRMREAYRWKNTIASVAERPGRQCLWGYRSTEGLGYHEYLQLCEDLGAEPLLVVNCGMAHKDVIPMDQMDPWVQDALDALEYANGPVTSKWGAMRAKAGHPKPYNIRLLEVGNENGGPAYNERYALFYDAVRKAYPEVKIIANLWGGTPTSRPFDFVDEHYYHDPNWFFRNANHYDNYSRSGPKIFVGEYAVTSGAGQGNLIAGLSEAAFMMGMERNADVVQLAAYAPLFVNVNNRAWNPDAICFDGTRAYGTPSYHVQKMFAEYRPDVSLPTKVNFTEGADKLLSRRPEGRGAVGVGTWRTQAEFKDVTITAPNGETLTVNEPPREAGGTWKKGNGVYQQTDDGEDRRLLIGDPNWTDYTLNLKARKTGGAEGFLILFRARDDRNFYWWNLGGWNNTRHAIERADRGSKSIASEAPGSIETGRWYDIKVEVKGQWVRCYLDGKLIHDFEEKGSPLFHAVVGKKKAQSGDTDYIVKIVNGSDEAQEAEIVLPGVGKPGRSLPVARVLTGPSAEAENSLDAPNKIAPVTTGALPTWKGMTARLRYTVPPRSLTALTVPVRP